MFAAAQSAVEPVLTTKAFLPSDFLQTMILLAIVSAGGVFVQWTVSVIALIGWSEFGLERKLAQLGSGFIASLMLGLLLRGTNPGMSIYLTFALMLAAASGGVTVITWIRERAMRMQSVH